MSNEEVIKPEAIDPAAANQTQETEAAADVTEQTQPLSAEAARIAELEAELQEAKEQMLRTAAEAQNVRRRAEKDVENAHKFALEKFASSLLDVADNLERAIGSANAEEAAVQSLLEGVQLTQKGLLEAMAKHGVELVDPAGEPFDPQRHEALSMIENPHVEPNTVLHVVQKGYALNGRLLRAAMVMVSKGGSSVSETA